MFSRNAKLVGLVGLLAGFIMGCGKSDDINPLASRHLVATVEIGSSVETQARAANNAFNRRNHCVQWIEYRLDGEAHGQRLEISNQACTSLNDVFPAQTRVARLRMSSAGNSIYNLYDRNADRRFGQFNVVSAAGLPNSLQLTSLCSFAQASERAFFQNNCSVPLAADGRIISVTAK